jgi:4-carboxymuconolactone decarboxylase
MDAAERRKLAKQITDTLPVPAEIEEDFGSFVADVVMGGVWSRPGMSSRDRSLMTIAALTALDRPNELRIHLGLGLDNGLEREEICEIIMHMAIYGGFPVAVEGMRIAKEVFEARASA